MKQTILTLSFLVVSIVCHAQINHVLNPDFEDNFSCPHLVDQIRLAKYWGSIDTLDSDPLCSPEYCNTCDTINLICSVPNNGIFYQQPHSGKGMAQVQMYYDESDPFVQYKRDYLYGKLSSSLIAGKSYCVTFFVNLEEASGYAINNIAAYLDNGNITLSADSIGCASPHIQYMPQIIETSVIDDTLNWTKVEGNFIAIGNERFVTIGNFQDTTHTTHVPSLWPEGFGAHYTWYLVDDVSVIESDLPAYAGRDTSIVQGDSVFMGRVPEIGLECKWYRGSTPLTMTLFDSTAGFWVHPDTTTYYVVEQTLCGNVKYDTVKITVGTENVGNVMNMSNVLVYPNPAKKVVNIANAISATVAIYDVVGKKVKEVAVNANKMQVPIGDLVSGVYLVEIRASDGSRKVVRLLKE